MMAMEIEYDVVFKTTVLAYSKDDALIEAQNSVYDGTYTSVEIKEHSPRVMPMSKRSEGVGS